MTTARSTRRGTGSSIGRSSEREALRHAVPREALDAAVPGGGTVRDLAREVLDIASAGLTARAMLNASGDNEGGFLDPLREVVASGMTPADRLLERYHGPWNGDVVAHLRRNELLTPVRGVIF